MSETLTVEQMEIVQLQALAQKDAEIAEHERIRALVISGDYEIQQTLGAVLGYPRYCDDQVNFPGATEADGVCVADHDGVTLAHEAADRIATLTAERDEFRQKWMLANTHAAFYREDVARLREALDAVADDLNNGGYDSDSLIEAALAATPAAPERHAAELTARIRELEDAVWKRFDSGAVACRLCRCWLVSSSIYDAASLGHAPRCPAEHISVMPRLPNSAPKEGAE